MRLTWNDPSNRQHESGVDRGVLYPATGAGLVWNGLLTVDESLGQVETTSLYYDGERYLQTLTAKDFSLHVEAYTYPDILDLNSELGFSYRTMISDGYSNEGFKLHLVYNALFLVGDISRSTLNAQSETAAFTWEVTTRPNILAGSLPSAHLVIDSRTTHPWVLSSVEELIYGSDTETPRLPKPQELMEIYEAGSILRITDHGDGTWTAEGPDEVVKLLDPSTFLIDWPSAVYIGSDTYTVSSM